MSDYTQVNDYSAKDALATGDANKVIKGSDVDAEFSALVTAVNSKSDSANPTFTGTVTATAATTNIATAADLTDSAVAASTSFVRNMLPAGILIPYAGVASPDTSVWLLCDGQAVSRTTYAVLFALVASTFGSGDGSTTFNVPDLRGRTVIGMDNYAGGAANRVTHANADTLGGVEGTETHPLVTAELAAHSHTVNITDPGHVHVQRAAASSSTGAHTGDTVNTGPVDTSTSTKTATTGITGASTNTGSGTAHENMSPYMAMGYLIKV